jgi:hypothetical protein
MYERLLAGNRRRKARRAEDLASHYELPSHVGRRVRRKAGLDEAGWELVERGLREWFICCAWRGRAVLGMPSRLVDEAWHEFILDSISYTAFCQKAFGAYLHHTPDEAMSTPMPAALTETVRAWDRSRAGKHAESVLWDLDERLGAPEPLGISGLELSAARTPTPHLGPGGVYFTGGEGRGGGAGNGGHHGHHGGGCGAGGGCGTGGCSGGCCGGGGS